MRVIAYYLVVCIVTINSFAQTSSTNADSAFNSHVLLENEPHIRLQKTLFSYYLAKRKGDSAEIAEISYLLGKRYSALGDYISAQQWFIRSLSIREPKGYSIDIGKVYLRLTENRVHLKQFDQALLYGHRALLNNQQVNSTHGLMSSYIVLAGAFSTGWQLYRKKKPFLARIYMDSSLYYTHQGERMARLLQSPSEIANICGYLSDTYLYLRNDKTTALHYAKQSLVLYEKQGNYHGIINSWQRMHRIYKSLHQYDAALTCLKKASQLATLHQVLEFAERKDLEYAYAQLYKQTNQWKLAFEHLEKYNELEEQAFIADREGAISRLGLKYESERKELQLKNQKEALANREKWLVLTLTLFGIAVAMSLLFFILFRKNRRISRWNAHLINEQNHRVKNNLQVVSSLLSLHAHRISDPAAIQAMEESQLRVQAIAVLHRRLYDGEQLIKVNLTTYIPDLVEGVLQTYGFTTLTPFYRLDSIWLHVDQSVPLGLIINELITNACKYALLNHPTPTLSITCHQWQRQISLSITDNGPGFTPSLNHTSLGMWLIDLQAEQLAGTYRFDCTAGTTFSLSFKS